MAHLVSLLQEKFCQIGPVLSRYPRDQGHLPPGRVTGGAAGGEYRQVLHNIWNMTYYLTAVLTSNGVFRKVSDTQFIIIVDNDTMVYIIYPKCDDAIVHQIAEIYYGIYSIPKILLCYIITKYHHMLPRYLKENQAPLITSWQFFIYLFFLFSFAC